MHPERRGLIFDHRDGVPQDQEGRTETAQKGYGY